MPTQQKGTFKHQQDGSEGKGAATKPEGLSPITRAKWQKENKLQKLSSDLYTFIQLILPRHKLLVKK